MAFHIGFGGERHWPVSRGTSSRRGWDQTPRLLGMNTHWAAMQWLQLAFHLRCLLCWRICLFGRPKQLLDLFQPLARSSAEEAKVTDFDKAFGRHMLQEAADKFFRRQRAEIELSGIRCSITKGYLVLLPRYGQIYCKSVV
jgi:hypothetical protein